MRVGHTVAPGGSSRAQRVIIHTQDPTVLSRDCDIVFCSLCVSMGSRSGNKSSFLYFRFLMPVEGQSLPPFYLFFCVFPSSFFHIILSREQCALTIWKEAIRWEGGKREREREPLVAPPQVAATNYVAGAAEEEKEEEEGGPQALAQAFSWVEDASWTSLLQSNVRKKRGD